MAGPRFRAFVKFVPREMPLRAVFQCSPVPTRESPVSGMGRSLRAGHCFGAVLAYVTLSPLLADAGWAGLS